MRENKGRRAENENGGSDQRNNLQINTIMTILIL